MDEVKLGFYGAANTVTGSRYLVSSGEARLLVDCGLFQGYKFLRERNWKRFPVEPSSLDAVVLTHAHLDHSGYLPALVASGLRGPIYATEATRDLCEILLRDAAKLQEEEAEFANRHQSSKHHPALPLFTLEQAEAALARMRTVPFDAPVQAIKGACEVVFHPNGHILGSASLEVRVAGRRILFSGDLGRPNDPIMRPPAPPAPCDCLVVESTYGDRLHDGAVPDVEIAKIVNGVLGRGGSLLIPAFAVGRAQTMLHLLERLREQKLVPTVPVYLDNPMAVSATELLLRHQALHRLSAAQCQRLSEHVTYVRTKEESIALGERTAPCVIISASGMATGGRVLHHLKRMVTEERNGVLFAGYQSGGTRGARLVAGEKVIKIFGKYFPVKASIHYLDLFSAHADYSEVLEWAGQLAQAPRQVFVTHGEAAAADSLRAKLKERFGWDVEVPEQGETATLRDR
jgi:metallo-beta-lactamase family protein